MRVNQSEQVRSGAMEEDPDKTERGGQTGGGTQLAPHIPFLRQESQVGPLRRKCSDRLQSSEGELLFFRKNYKISKKL